MRVMTILVALDGSREAESCAAEGGGARQAERRGEGLPMVLRR